jgi:hypothetical protein
MYMKKWSWKIYMLEHEHRRGGGHGDGHRYGYRYRNCVDMDMTRHGYATPVLFLGKRTQRRPISFPTPGQEVNALSGPRIGGDSL